MRALFIGFVWPEPKSSAAGQNIINYIDTCLEQNWHTWFCSSAQKTQHSADLTRRGVHTFECQLNCSSFNQQVSEINPDIVIFDRYLSFEQFAWRVKETCPDAMLVIDAEDLHFLRHARSLLVKDQKGSLQFQSSQAVLQPNNRSSLINDITLRELSCIYQADLSIVVSTFERDLLRDTFNVPEHQVSHVPFSLHCEVGANGESKSADQNVLISEYEHKQDFVFIGNFRHAPNYHAAKVLRENIWPQIYKNLKPIYPNISCHLYGAYMSPKAKQLENKAINFYLHGYTEDQYISISQARVMLAPITFGAGVKGKLIDAMHCNTPTVTTSIGAEGITKHDWPGIVSDEPESFIQSAIDLYSKQALWQRVVDNIDRILKDDYDHGDTAKSLIQVLTEAHQTLALRRETNLMQRLLQQQQFLASKYMSQWIEAKNRP